MKLQIENTIQVSKNDEKEDIVQKVWFNLLREDGYNIILIPDETLKDVITLFNSWGLTASLVE